MSEPLWVWGADVSTKRIAIAMRGEDRRVELLEFTRDLKTGMRLADIFRMTRAFAVGLARERPPLFVWVEQPASYGRVVEPALMYAVGVVQAALYTALECRSNYPTEVRTIAVAEWKKAALGFGNAKKHQVLAWAKQDGFASDHVCSASALAGKSTCADPAHDAADAWAIAAAGARFVGAEVTEAQAA